MSNKTGIQFENNMFPVEWNNLSLGQIILMQLPKYGNTVAQIDAHTDREQTFDTILNATQKLAIYLRREGLRQNDVIAICSENNLEFCIPLCAAFYLGGTACLLNPLYSERELKHSLSISKPKYIFASAVALSNIKNIHKDLHWSPKIITLADNLDKSWMSIYSIVSSIPDDSINTFQAAPVDLSSHVATILYSSGTTGLPKGVMLTDKNFIFVIKIMMSFMSSDSSDHVSLALLPFFHAYSFAILLFRLMMGSKSVVLSYFDEHLFLQSIEKYKVDHLAVVPPLMVFLAKHPLVDKYDLSSIREIACGAAPLSEEIQTAVIKRLNAPEIKQGYGLTETTLGVLLSSTKHTKLGSFQLVPGMSAKIISLEENETGKVLGPNCRGELCFKGEMIMKGYCNDEKATKLTIDEDGWLHTGDVGYYDEEGFFYVVDRIKELIKYKGYQVPPAELEAILLTCPGVKDVAVIGIPDEKVGELPMAFVVKQNNFNIYEKDIIQYVNERVSYPKWLRGGVRFINSIPKTPSGKILRRLLRDNLKSKL